jgi:hypothetical protein
LKYKEEVVQEFGHGRMSGIRDGNQGRINPNYLIPIP